MCRKRTHITGRPTLTQRITEFDANELQRIVRFIRTGGLDVARRKEKEEIAEQLRQLQRQQQNKSIDPVISTYGGGDYSVDLFDAFSAAGSLINWLTKR